ncbi:uncharacterized protein LOC133202652 [Saccostrea echinata]|uniref:uncharacterized protein LOC133202652 n=1 Tax=Saccostrea echinata TaxID=191078 RepID=UPI002A7EB23D|nr:uncharacterized protein LOC133202652 [Saccostrea echinata]
MAASNSSSLENGTSTGTNSPADENTTKVVFLVIFMVVGLLGNVVLIVTIGCNKKQRTSALQLFSLNLAFVNCLDCLFNMSFALITAIGSVSWSSEDFLCRLNSFFMNLIWVETILGLMFMTLDRMMATRHSDKYEQFQSIPRFIIMLIYTWVHSVSFSVPLLFGAIEVDVYENVKLCMMANNVSIIYTLIITLVCFFIPISVSIIFFSLAMKVTCSEHSNHAKRSQNQYSKEVSEPKLLRELKGAKYTGILLFLWIMMEVPYISSQLIRMFRYSEDLNINSSFEIPNSYTVDVSLVWFRFGFVIILPILALLWKKELWQLFKNIILCRKSNLIVDLEIKVENPPSREKLELKYTDDKKQAKEEKMKEAFVHNSGFQVPVLFATSQGVHIQTGSDEESDYDDIKIRGRKCDVLGSQGNLQGFEYETSDYDSSNELDPFSISHPISAKKSEEIHPSLQKRSSSHPEVGKSNKSEKRDRTVSKVSIASTAAADSGLEMSCNIATKDCSRNKEQDLATCSENLPSANDIESSESDNIKRYNEEGLETFSVLNNQQNPQETLHEGLLKNNNNAEVNDSSYLIDCSRIENRNLTMKKLFKLEPLQSPLKQKENLKESQSDGFGPELGRHQLYVKLPSLGSEKKESQETLKEKSESSLTSTEVMTPSGCKLVDVADDFQKALNENQ